MPGTITFEGAFSPSIPIIIVLLPSSITCALAAFADFPGIIIFEGAFSPSTPIIRVVFPSLITCTLAVSADFSGIIICEGAAKATTLPETKPKANVNDKTVFLIIDKCMI